MFRRRPDPDRSVLHPRQDRRPGDAVRMTFCFPAIMFKRIDAVWWQSVDIMTKE